MDAFATVPVCWHSAIKLAMIFHTILSYMPGKSGRSAESLAECMEAKLTKIYAYFDTQLMLI